MDPVLEDVEAGQDDLLHAGEVVLPDDLGLLPPTEDLRPGDGVEDLRDLQQLPLVNGETGRAPVDDLVKWELPAVGENDGEAAGLQGLQEPEGPQPSSSRYETEGGVGEEVLVVPLVVLRVVLLAPLVHHLPPVLAVLAGGHHHHVLPVVKVVEAVPGVAPDTVDIPLPFEGDQVLVRDGEIV